MPSRDVMTRSVLFIVSLAVFGHATASAQESVGRKYAILVGVREYDRNQLKNLPFAENDVAELAEILKQSGFRRVELLTQAEGAKKARALPLAKTIRETIKGVLEDREKDDLVLIAFAGHGLQFKGEKENYFCPMDAVLTDRSTLISLTDVYEQLKQSKAGAKLLLVDACRNDPLAGNARAAGDVELQSATRPQIPDPPGGVAAFFSCSAGQRAFEDEMLKHGVFFHHVILGLKGEAKLKKREEVTWDSLVAYVKAEVPDTVKDLFGNTTRQIPEHRGELRGGATLVSFILTEPSRAVAPFDASVARNHQEAWAKFLRTDVEITNSIGMKMRLVPPGEFDMGSPEKEPLRQPNELQHRQTIKSPLMLGAFEVTQAEFHNVMGFNSSYERNQTPDKPVIYERRPPTPDQVGMPIDEISLWDTLEFCNRLSEREGLPQYYEVANVQRKELSIESATVTVRGGKGYRLPEESEWEFACRAGTTTAFSTGVSISNRQANCYPRFSDDADNLKGWTDQNLSKAGSFPPNAFGLFDMHGNVAEVCWCPRTVLIYKNGGNTLQFKMTVDAIPRGGTAFDYLDRVRSASRPFLVTGKFTSLTEYPGIASNGVGFRVCQSK